jgi:hypothetical protein
MSIKFKLPGNTRGNSPPTLQSSRVMPWSVLAETAISGFSHALVWNVCLYSSITHPITEPPSLECLRKSKSSLWTDGYYALNLNKRTWPPTQLRRLHSTSVYMHDSKDGASGQCHTHPSFCLTTWNLLAQNVAEWRRKKGKWEMFWFWKSESSCEERMTRVSCISHVIHICISYCSGTYFLGLVPRYPYIYPWKAFLGSLWVLSKLSVAWVINVSKNATWNAPRKRQPSLRLPGKACGLGDPLLRHLEQRMCTV